MSGGWISLHRSLQKHWIFNFDEPDKALAWIDLLLSARHEPGSVMIKGQLIELDAGQVAMSQITLQKRWKMSQNKVKRFLKLLENEGMATVQANALTTIITICNYKDFQTDGRTGERTNERADERATNVPRTTRRTTNNNDNKGNKGNKDNKKHTSPKDDERVVKVFEYWKQVMNKTDQTMLSPKRKKAIFARIKEGYKFEDFRLAIDSCFQSAFHMGQNDNQTLYNDIELICRTGEKLEQFRDSVGKALPNQMSALTRHNVDVLNNWRPEDE